MNTLFIGIYDSNEPNTSMRQAFRSVSNEYKEISINNHREGKLNTEIIDIISGWGVDLIFMQLQYPGIINHECLMVMKATGAMLIQWTGDARQPLPKHYIEFGRQIDLSLFNNKNDVDTMLGLGVNTDFLQIAFDHNIYNPVGTRIKSAPIVFMGNNYNNIFPLSDNRFRMCDFLRRNYGDDFKMYGSNWPKRWGIENIMYQQQREAEIYRSCKIGISISHFDLKSYASDRPFRIMGSGALCIAKEWPDMEEYDGGRNFVTYNGDFRDLKNKIDYYLKAPERTQIAHNGCEYVHTYCTWDNRVEKLLTLIKKHGLDSRIKAA